MVLNGVMMGLGRREAQRRLDAVLDFAGLREFADLKLKNYSSGMMVRLAFAVMVEADADIMLVDEVLAVGDAEFAQKCMDVFQARRRAGRTLVLVTHDMATVESMCDRAMLIEDGELAYLGDPGETALRYFRVNFARAHASPEPDPSGGVWDVNVRPVDAWLENAAGERVAERRAGRADRPADRRRGPPRADVAGVRHPLRRRAGEHHLRLQPRRWRTGPSCRPAGACGSRGRLRTGCCRAATSCSASSPAAVEQGDVALHQLRLLDFVVYGIPQGKGIVAVDADVEAELE